MGYNSFEDESYRRAYRRAEENMKRVEDNYWKNRLYNGIRPSHTPKQETEKLNSSNSVMNALNAVVIGNLISAHYEGDDKKFDVYANFIAEAYEQRGDLRGAKIIRSRMDGSYKNESTISLDDANELTKE